MKILNKSILNNILIIRLSSMGDVIIATPLIRLINQKFPDAKIDFAVAQNFADILKYNPRINNIYHYDKSIPRNMQKESRNKFLSEINLKQYDLLIDLQKNIRSYQFSSGIFKSKVSMNKNRLHKLSLVYCKKPLKSGLRVAEEYIRTVDELGVKPDKKCPEIWLQSDLDSGRYLPHFRKQTNEIKNIVIAPGAHHYTKQWPKEKFAALVKLLIEKYNCSIKLTGGNADVQICDDIIRQCGMNIENIAGRTDIIGTTELIDKSDLVISNDTGVMHIASARNVPVAAIFGSTVPELGFSPYNVKHEIVQKSIKCRPCTHIGRAECPKGHFDCMKKIEPSDIIMAVEKLFSRS